MRVGLAPSYYKLLRSNDEWMNHMWEQYKPEAQKPFFFKSKKPASDLHAVQPASDANAYQCQCLSVWRVVLPQCWNTGSRQSVRCARRRRGPKNRWSGEIFYPARAHQFFVDLAGAARSSCPRPGSSRLPSTHVRWFNVDAPWISVFREGVETKPGRLLHVHGSREECDGDEQQEERREIGPLSSGRLPELEEHSRSRRF
jgi:hypothetical protein